MRTGLPEGILSGTGAGRAAREAGFQDAGPGLHMGTCRPPPHSPWLQLTGTFSQRAIGRDGTTGFNAQGGSVWTANLYKSHQAKSMPFPSHPQAPSQNTPCITNGRESLELQETGWRAVVSPSPRPRLPGTGAAHRQADIQGTWLAIGPLSAL